ncbi:MAG: YciI family protein, partial [Burkholderiales bacterium]
MPYAILTTDKPNSAELRAKVRDTHIQYLTANLHKLLAAGALTADDGTGGHGSVFLV